jgi:ribose transport system substrate-binding protein
MSQRIPPPTRWRRVGASLAATIAAVALAPACSSGTSNPPGQKAPKDAHIAFIYDTTASNFAQEMALGAQAAGSETGVDLNTSAPPAAIGSDQVKLFQAAEGTSTDGMALATLFPDLFVRPLTDAHQRKIPLIAVDAPAAKGAPVDLFIGNDNFQLGVDLANALLPRIPANKPGEILVGTDTPGLPVLTARNDGFESVIQQQRPGVTFVEFNSKQAPTDNYTAWSAAVAAHPNALAYVGPGSQDAASLAQIQQRTGQRLLAGADDLDPLALQGIKNGYIQALVSPEHWLKGYLAVELLAAHATQGKALPTGWWNPGSLVVDAANIDKILARQATPAARTAYFSEQANAQLADPGKYLKPMSTVK